MKEIFTNTLSWPTGRGGWSSRGSGPETYSSILSCGLPDSLIYGSQVPVLQAIVPDTDTQQSKPSETSNLMILFWLLQQTENIPQRCFSFHIGSPSTSGSKWLLLPQRGGILFGRCTLTQIRSCLFFLHPTRRNGCMTAAWCNLWNYRSACVRVQSAHFPLLAALKSGILQFPVSAS